MARLIILLVLMFAASRSSAQNVDLPEPNALEGYLARLLINETAFPGEQGYVSEADTMRAMDNILLVLDARIYFVPDPYTRFQVAQTSSDKLLDVITAGGQHGQVDGFFLSPQGSPAMVPRITKRVDYLLSIANTGPPGRFARLLNHALTRSHEYIAKLHRPENKFLSLRLVLGEPVTGRAYSWMTDRYTYHSGGNFVRIPNALSGSLSGNRFFTLRDLNR